MTESQKLCPSAFLRKGGDKKKIIGKNVTMKILAQTLIVGTRLHTNYVLTQKWGLRGYTFHGHVILMK